MTDGLRILLRLAQMPPLADVIESRIRPTGPLDSDDALRAPALDKCKTAYRPRCTCLMGVGSATSVVDPPLRVHGVEGLRVIDASIMPSVVFGNTNAATTMIGEKGADLVLQAHA